MFFFVHQHHRSIIVPSSRSVWNWCHFQTLEGPAGRSSNLVNAVKIHSDFWARWRLHFHPKLQSTSQQSVNMKNRASWGTPWYISQAWTSILSTSTFGALRGTPKYLSNLRPSSLYSSSSVSKIASVGGPCGPPVLEIALEASSLIQSVQVIFYGELPSSMACKWF